MTVYMLRDNKTGLWYRRTKGSGGWTRWVDQKKASIWVAKNGPAQVISMMRSRARGKPIQLEIISYQLVEKPECTTP
jgi:hypothetical protein